MSNETTTKSVLEALQNDDVKTLKEYLLAGKVTFNYVLYSMLVAAPLVSRSFLIEKERRWVEK